MHGITNHVFRNCYQRHFHGFDYAIAPFISTIRSERTSAKRREKQFKDILPNNNSQLTIIPQVIGNDAASFIDTAKMIEQLGYDEVNLNMGCPSPTVTTKKKGSGFLPHKDMIQDFLDQICEKADIEISIKVRLGMYDQNELFDLMPIFNNYPLKKIIIHPRTGKQIYDGTVDLDSFSQAAALSSHKIMYNGDIKDVATFEMLRSRFPEIKEWMIGRWAISNPFLPSLLKGDTQPASQSQILKMFHDDLYQAYEEILFGPTHLLNKIKEIWGFLIKSFAVSDKLLSNIFRSKTVEDYSHAVDAVFKQCPF